MTGLRDKILKTLDLPSEEFYVSRWDQTILVRGAAVGHPRLVAYMEGDRRKNQPDPSAHEQTIRRNVGTVILCALDPDTGKQIFSWSDADDLREKHYNTILQISAKAFELAGGDSPVEMRAEAALDFLEAYGRDQGWSTEQFRHVGELRALVEENITQHEDDEGDVSRETSSDEDGSSVPLEEPRPEETERTT